MSSIANKREFLVTAQALVKASTPDENHIETCLKALSKVLSDIYSEPVTLVAILDQEPS